MIVIATLATACAEQGAEERSFEPWPDVDAPIAKTTSHSRIIHGDTVVDNYYWMIDYFKKGPDSSEVIDYLNAENHYVSEMMADTEPLQQTLFEEMKARIKESDQSVPFFKNGYYYYRKTEEGKQYYKVCRKKGSLDAQEEVLLDVDQMAEGYAYYALSGYSISPDNQLLIYGVDTVSRREYTLYVKNLETGEILPEKISRTTGSGVWANDSKTFFYTSKNKETLLSEKIKRHELGQSIEKDAVVYEEKDKSNYIGLRKSKNDRYIFIQSENTMSSEVYLLDADRPMDPFQVFQKRKNNVLYYVTALEDRFLIQTNQGAHNFKIMETSLDNTSESNWKEYLAHREDVLIEDIEEFKDFIVISERQDGLLKFAVRSLTGEDSYYLEFDEPAYAISGSTNVEYDTDVFRYGYTSLITPSSVYDYNLKTGERVLLKQQEVLGGYNPSEYTSERIMVPARDGAEVPLSIVYKKGTKKKGRSPLLLYAYGSYGYSMDASFSSSRLSLLDRGFIFAIAHIRGGEEMGRAWYEDGKLMKKMNTFNDFIDCGKYLIENKYTSPAHLYAQGGSAGGLLMGAVINLEPELWNGVIAAVPFVDVVNTMLDETIPLTTNEYDEWGNPNEEEAYYYMKGYSPYENIEAKEYPNLLVTTGLHDSQVQYFEPAKWVAKLRATKKGNNVVLLKTDMEYGHGGASGRFDYLKDLALEYAFLLKLENMEK